MKFFFSAQDYLASLKAALNAAQIGIDIEMYIFASDRVGWEIADILAKKAYSGVPVRLIYDSLGCQGTDTELFNLLEENGVQLQEFNPTFPFFRKLRRRNHRKVLIIDGQVGFLGGFNLMDVDWRDTGVKLETTALVNQLSQLFEFAWQGRTLRLLDLAKRKWKLPLWQPGDIEVVPSYGLRHFSLIRQEYLMAILNSRRRIWITNPYFIPDHGILRALRRAARRGVDVRILTAGQSDVRIARWAGHAVYSFVLKKGVRVFEYQPHILHAKIMIVDDLWFTVGTANLDHLSLFHNLEVNLVGADAAATQTLADQFEEDLLKSREIIYETWKHRSRWIKFRERFFYYFRAWM